LKHESGGILMSGTRTNLEGECEWIWQRRDRSGTHNMHVNKALAKVNGNGTHFACKSGM